LKKDTLIILESTSPVGATEQLAAWIAEQRPDLCIASEASDKKSIDGFYRVKY
jgi:UDP-N-acetyl-D-mannosaminuronic acid dehydrogenase